MWSAQVRLRPSACDWDVWRNQSLSPGPLAIQSQFPWAAPPWHPINHRSEIRSEMVRIHLLIAAYLQLSFFMAELLLHQRFLNYLNTSLRTTALEVSTAFLHWNRFRFPRTEFPGRSTQSCSHQRTTAWWQPANNHSPTVWKPNKDCSNLCQYNGH